MLLLRRKSLIFYGGYNHLESRLFYMGILSGRYGGAGSTINFINLYEDITGLTGWFSLANSRVII